MLVSSHQAVGLLLVGLLGGNGNHAHASIAYNSIPIAANNNSCSQCGLSALAFNEQMTQQSLIALTENNIRSQAVLLS